MEPILLLKVIVLQGLQITFYRETEKIQYFWLNTELRFPWAQGQIMWTLCSSPLPTHNLGRGRIKRSTGGVIIPHVLFLLMYFYYYVIIFHFIIIYAFLLLCTSHYILSLYGLMLGFENTFCFTMVWSLHRTSWGLLSPKFPLCLISAFPNGTCWIRNPKVFNLSLKGINVDYHIYHLNYLNGYAADIEERSFTRLSGL